MLNTKEQKVKNEVYVKIIQVVSETGGKEKWQYLVCSFYPKISKQLNQSGPIFFCGNSHDPRESL